MPDTPSHASFLSPRWWLVVAFIALLPAVTPRLYASDEVQYFAYLRSLWFDHDVSFENEYRYFYDRGVARSAGFHETFLERRTETGKRLNFGTIGSALLWSPFYGVADVTARVGARLGLATADGFSAPYLFAVAVGSAVYGWLSLLLAAAVAARVVGDGQWGPHAALLVWFGTPLVFYMYVAPPMAHACSAFSVAFFVWTWLRVRHAWTPGGCAALGLVAALMAMVREQDALLVIGPIIDVVYQMTKGHLSLRRAARGCLTAAAAFAVGFLPQALAYRALNGYVGPSRLVTRKMTWYAPHALEVLASPSHGLLWWTPLVVLSLAGLVWLARAQGRSASAANDEAARDSSVTRAAEPPLTPRLVVLGLVAMVLSQIYVAGSVESWTVAGAFGQRRFVNLTVVLVVGLAGFLAWCGRQGWSRRCVVALGLCVWWNIGLMAQFGTGAMDRQRLEPLRNARYTFITLPATFPSLAYRYLFDRSSFYKPIIE